MLKVPKIKIPVLIIEGEEDKLLPKLDSIEMYHQIKNASQFKADIASLGVEIEN